MKSTILTGILIVLCVRLFAQTPSDALTMSRGQVCIAALFSQQDWRKYWEGTRLRENENIGQMKVRSGMAMGAIGIGNRLNLLASLPYVHTSATQGQFAGQQGIQDFSAWAKFKLMEATTEKSRFRLFTVAGGSVPVGDYIPDYLPFSIGLQAKTGTIRLIADYKHHSGFYLTWRGSHTWRSSIALHRDAFLYKQTLYQTNKLPLPNAIETALLTGWRKGAWVSTISLEYADHLDGDDIRRNDMPFPSNRMRGLSASLSGKYQGKHLGATLAFNQTIEGRNIGLANQWTAGLLYLFHYQQQSK